MIDTRERNRLDAQLSTFKGMLRKSRHVFHNVGEWDAFNTLGVSGYVNHIADVKSEGTAKTLKLGAPELAKLYSIDVAGLRRFTSLMEESIFSEFVFYDADKGVLKVDDKKVEKFLVAESTVTFTKKQSELLKKIEAIEVAVKEAMKISPSVLNLISTNTRTGEVKPLVAQIKSIV